MHPAALFAASWRQKRSSFDAGYGGAPPKRRKVLNSAWGFRNKLSSGGLLDDRENAASLINLRGGAMAPVPEPPAFDYDHVFRSRPAPAPASLAAAAAATASWGEAVPRTAAPACTPLGARSPAALRASGAAAAASPGFTPLPAGLTRSPLAASRPSAAATSASTASASAAFAAAPAFVARTAEQRAAVAAAEHRKRVDARATAAAKALARQRIEERLRQVSLEEARQRQLGELAEDASQRCRRAVAAGEAAVRRVEALHAALLLCAAAEAEAEAEARSMSEAVAAELLPAARAAVEAAEEGAGRFRVEAAGGCEGEVAAHEAALEQSRTSISLAEARLEEAEARLEEAGAGLATLREAAEAAAAAAEQEFFEPDADDVLDENFPPGRRRFEPRQLTEAEEAVVSEILQPGNPAEKLFEINNTPITRKDIATLKPLEWLNDEVRGYVAQVINCFVELLRQHASEAEQAGEPLPKVHIFSSLFYTKLAESPEYTYGNVRRWTKRAKVDLFSRDLVIVPINQGNMHWTLGLINLRQKRFEFIDSMHGSDGGRLAVLRRYLKDEHQDKKGAPLDLGEDWVDISYTAADGTPRQTNGFDCGMFMSRTAEYLVRDAVLDFTQADMPNLRRRMVFELSQKALTD